MSSQNIRNIIFILICLYTCTAFSYPFTDTNTKSYYCDTDKQIRRSLELQKLIKADQDDRVNWQNLTPEELEKISYRDLNRRKKVGVIFAEGCFTNAEDYAAAALIYQHGLVPDHYYQAFTWANKAVELGKLDQENLVAQTLDRYLVTSGKKQLFATQAFASEETHWCYCLKQVESSFPDSKRIEFTNKSLDDRFKWLASINKSGCSNAMCPFELKDVPEGSIVGFW
jgi:hypothetical protein